MLKIAPASTDADYAVVRSLIGEYASTIDHDLEFQHLAVELADPRTKYMPPRGCFLTAYHENELVGCVAVREQTDDVCEMKRLYVRPQYRRTGHGRDLALAAVARAREIGYKRMRLDTLGHMQAARELYRSLGFYEIPPYYNNPLPDVVYYELDLAQLDAPS